MVSPGRHLLPVSNNLYSAAKNILKLKVLVFQNYGMIFSIFLSFFVSFFELEKTYV
ncbi:unnamed protein product, partial [marine sediment metagenome]